MDLSIIVPFYKGTSYIEKCIRSITGSYALSRQILQYELIIVVDSPDEASVAFIRQIEARHAALPLKVFINDRNHGVAWSRNLGLSQSSGTFVTFIDQDDRVNYNYFAVLEKRLNVRYDCLLLNGYFYYPERRQYKKVHFVKPDFRFESLLRQRDPAPTPGLMIFNRRRLPRENFFPDVSDQYKGCDDWAAYLQLSLRCERLSCCYVAVPVFIICKHDANYSNDLMQMFLCDFAVLQYFKRLLPDGKRKRLVDKIIRMKHLRIDRDVHRMTRKELRKKHGYVYFQYLYNKRCFWRYIGRWFNKKLFALWGKIDVRE
jgi:glycosyltransferase involved in cell wall biosynthesis